MIETKTRIRMPPRSYSAQSRFQPSKYALETPEKSSIMPLGENRSPNLPNAGSFGERVSYIKHTPAKKSLSGSTLEEAKVISLTPRVISNHTNTPQYNRTPLSVIPENSQEMSFIQHSSPRHY